MFRRIQNALLLLVVSCLSAVNCFVTVFRPTIRPSFLTERTMVLLTRRDILSLTTTATTTGACSVLVLTTLPSIVAAADDTVESMINELEVSRQKLKPIPAMIQAENWEGVRQILKTPPVNNLWNMGDAKNTILKIAKATDEFGLVDVKDELSISLQMCDQLVYDNVFVYFQPGNGKVKVKEPADLAMKAIAQLGEAIEMAKSI